MNFKREDFVIRPGQHADPDNICFLILSPEDGQCPKINGFNRKTPVLSV